MMGRGARVKPKITFSEKVMVDSYEQLLLECVVARTMPRRAPDAILPNHPLARSRNIRPPPSQEAPMRRPLRRPPFLRQPRAAGGGTVSRHPNVTARAPSSDARVLVPA